MKRDLIFLFSDTKNKVWNEKRLYLNILKKVFNIHIFYFSENSLKNYNFFEKKNFFNFKKKFNNPIFMNYLSIKKKNYEIFNTLKINNCKQVFVYSLRPKFKSLSLMSYLNKYYLNFLLKLFFKKIKSFFLYEKKYTFNYDHYITNDMSIPKKKLIKMHENNYYKFLDYKKISYFFWSYHKITNKKN